MASPVLRIAGLCLLAGLAISSAGAGKNSKVPLYRQGGGTVKNAVRKRGANILNNGGFEYGLMCYGDYVWSVTGKDYKGDYDFALSKDSHSGPYSLEIRCNGADCEKAAIISNKIHTPPNQAYKLRLYTKCPTRRKAAIYLPATARGDIMQGLACRDDWALNEISFKTAPHASTFQFSIYNQDVEWLRVDDVVLTYDDGTVPQQRPVLHAGTRNVGISGGDVTVDGKPYLALGFFGVGYEDLKLVADIGANTVIPDTGPQCFNTEQPSYSDRAYELGLGVAPDSTTSARLKAPEIFPAIMKRFAPHLANVGWFLVDEPDQRNVPWYYLTGPSLVAEYNAAKSQTNLPMIVDFQRAAWSSRAEVMPYMSSADVWMAEPYGADFGRVNHAISVFNSLRSRPIWLAQDSVDANLIVPKAYLALISGARGIMYYSWQDFSKDFAKSQTVHQAFAELKQLKDVIFGQNIDSQVAAPEGISYIARQYQGTTYILAVNSKGRITSGKFAVRGLSAGKQITVLFENRTLAAAAGKFSDTFEGVSKHVYLVH